MSFSKLMVPSGMTYPKGCALLTETFPLKNGGSVYQPVIFGEKGTIPTSPLDVLMYFCNCSLRNNCMIHLKKIERDNQIRNIKFFWNFNFNYQIRIQQSIWLMVRDRFVQVWDSSSTWTENRNVPQAVWWHLDNYSVLHTTGYKTGWHLVRKIQVDVGWWIY